MLMGMYELRKREKKTSYLTLDVSKAYDNVWREGLV